MTAQSDATRDNTRAKPSMWIDSNVMAEIMSKGDLYADLTRGALLVERRRMMLQGSFWLATALDEQRVVTVSYRHEVKRTVEKLAPPTSAAGVWTFMWFASLRPYVFNRWRSEFTDQGAELRESDERDQLMVDLCKADGFALVSRDGGVHKRARRAGVHAMTPEEYASTVLPVERARARFFERFATAALHCVAEGERFDQPRRAECMKNAHDAYRTIWAAPGYMRGPFGSMLSPRR